MIEWNGQKRGKMCVFTRLHPVLITADRDDQRVVWVLPHRHTHAYTHRLYRLHDSSDGLFVQRHGYRVPDWDRVCQSELGRVEKFGVSQGSAGGGHVGEYVEAGVGASEGVHRRCVAVHSNRLLVVLLCRLFHPSHRLSIFASSAGSPSRELASFLSSASRHHQLLSSSIRSLRADFCSSANERRRVTLFPQSRLVPGFPADMVDLGGYVIILTKLKTGRIKLYGNLISVSSPFPV